MGGATSEVSDGTTEVVVESAIFDPVSIRRTAQRLALRSEASSRFEKGQESRLARLGADRTAQLVRAWAGGEIARASSTRHPWSRPRPAWRSARRASTACSGTDLTADEQRDLLARVGMDTEPAGTGEPVTIALRPEPLAVAPGPGTALAAVVPTWRRDIAIEADLAEEIARVRGYELVPSVTPDTMMPGYRPSPLETRELVRETLAGAGLTEVVTTALVSPRHIETFVLGREVPSIGDEDQPGGDAIAVGNPLSRDHSLLRRNLLGSLLDVVGVNLRHGTEDVAVFEIGKGYARTGESPREWWRLGFALTGAAEPAAWNRAARPYDLDDAKGVLELLAHRLGLGRPAYAAETGEGLFHPGRTARAGIPGRLHAIVGELHPDLVDAWELRTTGRVIVAEVAIDGLAGGRLAPEQAAVGRPLPRGGPRPRDRRAGDRATPRPSRPCSASSAGDLLRDVRLFDIYRGVPLDGEEKSLAFRLRFGAATGRSRRPRSTTPSRPSSRPCGTIGARLRA